MKNNVKILWILGILLIISSAIFFYPSPQKVSNTADVIQPTPTPAPTVKPTDTVSFVAAGDNLIHGSIYLQAARRSEESGGYDFDYLYENIEYYFDDFDVKFINQETLVTPLEPSTYPMFSSPLALGDKVIEMGFNVIGTSNNHSYDKGVDGIYKTLQYWNSKDVINTGFYTGDNTADIKYLETNNIKMSFLAYTFSTNGLNIYDETSPYVISPSDYEIVREQVKIAKENSEVVIVSIHWGTENSNEVNSYQKDVVMNLNEMGVDVIIGTHPHVVQTVENYINPETGFETLVCYSLGNFVSAQSVSNNMIGGLFQFDITKTYDLDGNFTIDIINPYFVPLVTHYDYNFSNIRNYLLKDYTQELASTHGVSAMSAKFSMEYIENIINTYIPEEYLLYK